jgi:DNA-binding NtrC family response regulator
VRIVSATNRDLIADVKAGRFREDLFYRLHVFPISVPPLHARRDDIPELVRHFLARISAEEGKRVMNISAEAMNLLAASRWPGNVRQLENAIFRAVVLADGEEIGVNEFPQIAAALGEQSHDAVIKIVPNIPDAPALAISSFAVAENAQAVAASALTMDGTALALIDGKGDVRPLEDIERDVIRFAITHYRGQMSEVARKLQIGRSTLYRKLDGLGLDDGEGALEENAAAE